MRLLHIYLNDHLAGATAGVELARRIAKAQKGKKNGEAFQRLAEEIADDREALLRIMRTLNVPVQRYKMYAGWIAEKAGRLKPNGHLTGRSPLSDLVELEVMRLGIEGKASGWRTLRAVADEDDRLSAEELDELIARARRQADTAEELRTETAEALFGR
jgi:hypothetical protein